MQFYTTAKLSENILTTPEGYLVCVGVPIARTGEMIYAPGEIPIEPGEDGKIVITRDADEVFREETIKSFQGKPVTIFHPKELVSPKSWKTLAHGIVQNVRRGEGEFENDLLSDFLITDEKAIQLVKDGLREVSCGYEADYLETGIGRGQQKNIVGNHVALVDQGRAGSSYAINDHKGKGLTMKLGDKFKAIFKKAEDEALRAATADADMPGQMVEASSYDAMCSQMDSMKKSMDEMMTAFKGMNQGAKAKDAVASTQPTQSQPAEVKAVDAEVAPDLETRMKVMEEKVDKILQSLSTPAGDEEVEMEETDDAFGEESEEEETGDEFPEKEEKKDKAKTGDSAADPDEDDDDDDDDELEVTSRAEILAPGIKKDQTNLKAKALKVAYATTDGKKVIDVFTNGKQPDLKNEKLVGYLFTGASEILKRERVSSFSKTKTYDTGHREETKGAMTPDKLNELNAKFYGAKN